MFGKVKTLHELLGIELSYAYDCEKKLVEKGLPSMIQSANSNELRSAFQEHLTETQAQVARLERVFSSINMQPDTKTNEIFDEMTAAAKDSISNIDQSPLRDVALIVNGNIVEHYEIALYGSLSAFARTLGLQEAISLLEETLSEEKGADAKLTQIAETVMNAQAKRQSA
jgi:ferritin-like metal-binding protein YciE